MSDESSVLVTGGTGSFGVAAVRELLRRGAFSRVIVYSRDELKQEEMRRALPDPRLRFFLGDVRDQERLRLAFRSVDTVIHAAALKQVPAAEYNPFECVKTNVFGTQNVVEAALWSGVRRVLALSTDKACQPVNLYGATKLCADKLVVAANSYRGRGDLRLSVVRYGNVLGSRGSVVPLFRAARETGRLPVTDPTMTRFWITLDQGVRFVLDRLDAMRGGEIFVPKLPSATVATVAEAVAPGCALDVIGVRPGEKLHEVLIGVDDARRTRDTSGCYVIAPEFPWWDGDAEAVGSPVPADFSYASDTNPDRLDVAGVRRLLAEAGLA